MTTYSCHDIIKKIGIPLYSGNKIYNETLHVNDANYVELLHTSPHEKNLDPCGNYFQTREITEILYDYIRSDDIKAKIIDENPYKSRYGNNNDIFIHVRLEDIMSADRNLPLNYYRHAVKNIVYDKMYIATTSDHQSLNSTIIKELLKYPGAELFLADEINTIQFGSTCKYAVLSHGSFSAVIGWLAFDSLVFWPEINKEKQWCGDMYLENDTWYKILTDSYKCD